MTAVDDPTGRRAHDAYHRFVRDGAWAMSRLVDDRPAKAPGSASRDRDFGTRAIARIICRGVRYPRAMMSARPEDLDALVARMNESLAQDPRWSGRSLGLDDLAAMRDHYVLWASLRANGWQAPATTAADVTVSQVVEAVCFLVRRGSTLSLHPWEVRAANVASLASQIKVTEDTVGMIWTWWSELGETLFAPKLAEE